ncbi:MAG: UDP-N-acetylmuramoyl-tripeptide--D-alanyl-D-alanine ligase [Actinomycetota bacterium]
MRIAASTAARAVGGRLIGPDVEFDGASFDSRTTQPGQLFVPLIAERDGHDFIGDARSRGAVAHLTSRPDGYRHNGTAIEVADTATALAALAQWARQHLDAEAVGITGSVGKTSTKDLVAAAVRVARRTTANERSFNNEQGLPVTILGAPSDAEVLVLEMGMRGFGQISALCEIGRPSIGVVTAVADAHTELVGDIDGVARAKRELVEALPRHGTAVLNADDPRVRAMATATAASVLTFGIDGDVRVVDLTLDERARARFRLATPWGEAPISLGVSGGHMAFNAAAAIAVAGTLGVDLGSAIAGVERGELSSMRMEVIDHRSGAAIVNDAYNANPTSMRAALEAVAAMRGRRKIAVLGLMAELEDPVAGHREVAGVAAELGVEIVAVGTADYGIAPVDDPAGVAAVLGDLRADDVVLVKASRAAGLERVVQALISESAD